MNKYRAGGPSKASATTLCQKCLKRGHYTYECTAAQQERPYVSRPSRSQQLLNPKLAPKISATAPPVEAKTEVSNSKSKGEEPRDRKRSSPDTESAHRSKRRRSSSVSSADSVSTISTNRSRSRSPSKERRSSEGRVPLLSVKEPSTRYKHRRHDISPDVRQRPEQHRSRREASPRRHRSRSASPQHGTELGGWNDRRRSRSRSPFKRADMRSSNAPPKEASGPVMATEQTNRERSLSPYSRRMALTRSMNAH